MAFEWDEQKRAANLEKHGIDFELARRIFDAAVLEGPDNRREYGEPRIAAYGVAREILLFVIYTWRDGNRRIISARKASTEERRIYDMHLTKKGRKT